MVVGVGLIAVSMAIVGCGHETKLAQATPPTAVTVSQPLAREIVDYELVTGRTQAVNSVDFQPRVTGYLDKVHFQPGQEVKAGDLLFEIDPRPYKAELDRLNGQVALTQASLQLAIAENKRAKGIAAENAAAISKQDLDKYAAQEVAAEAQVTAAKASAEGAKLNLDFCKINAPLDGKISKSSIDPGNLVTANMTVLTNVVSVDPMYATFDVDERTMLRIQKLIREGKVKARETNDVSVYLGLADDLDFPHEGKINFVDNRVDPTTGTLRVRAQFPNDKRVLSPGLFAKLKLPIGEPRQALLVAERALGTDQGQKFVYVVNEEKKVEYRPVKVGMLENGLRAIEDGLKPGDWVITNGLQRVRPGVQVDAQRSPMPGVETVASATPAKPQESPKSTDE